MKCKDVLKFSIGLPLLLVASLGLSACGTRDDSNTTPPSPSSKNQHTTATVSKNKGNPAKKSATSKDKKAAKALPVEVAQVSRGDIQRTYATIASFAADDEVTVVSRTSGILERIFVNEGDHVKRGQRLAQLDTAELKLQLEQLEATRDKLRNSLERARALYIKKLGSADDLEKIRFEYRAQEALYQSAKLKLDYASIRSPIDGTVVRRLVKRGNLVELNKALFDIVNLASLRGILNLPEKELAEVRRGQQVYFHVDAFENTAIPGIIERIRPIIDSDTGTFRVTVKINNDLEKLRPGMFGRAEIVFDTHHDSLLVDQQAIITQDNQSHVFRVANGKAMQSRVETGFARNGKVEILKGLKASDRVIITGQQLVRDQSPVEVIKG